MKKQIKKKFQHINWLHETIPYEKLERSWVWYDQRCFP